MLETRQRLDIDIGMGSMYFYRREFIIIIIIIIIIYSLVYLIPRVKKAPVTREFMVESLLFYSKKFIIFECSYILGIQSEMVASNAICFYIPNNNNKKQQKYNSFRSTPRTTNVGKY